MPTVPTTSSDGVDYEPDNEWKAQLWETIAEGFQLLVADAKESLVAERRKAPDTPETRICLEADYNQAIQTLKTFALEQYERELDQERNQRRWAAGIPMSSDWIQYFREEQQNIMNSIKQSNSQTDNCVRTPSEDGGRYIYSEPRRATTYPYPAPRRSPYTNPSPRPVPQDYHEQYMETQDNVHPGSPRQASYIRQQDNPDRVFSENGSSWIIPLWECISC